MSLSDESTDEQSLLELDQSNFKNIHEKAEKVGYADGIAAGNESVFQSGFDKGYADGLNTGFHLEKYRSFCSTISNSNATPELTAEANNFIAINLADTTKSDHFQYTKHKEESIEIISQHQKDYIEQRLQELNEKLPNTSNLLSLKN